MDTFTNPDGSKYHVKIGSELRLGDRVYGVATSLGLAQFAKCEIIGCEKITSPCKLIVRYDHDGSEVSFEPDFGSWYAIDIKPLLKKWDIALYTVGDTTNTVLVLENQEPTQTHVNCLCLWSNMTKVLNTQFMTFKNKSGLINLTELEKRIDDINATPTHPNPGDAYDGPVDVLIAVREELIHQL